jgi:uncharacterized protein YndB with AHSA1/START domain
MLLKILIVLGIIVIALAIAIATRPPSYRVTRSRTIGAPATAIFRFVNDFHQWIHWSPFEKLDPNLQRTFSGTESGVGAKYAWLGNRQAGEGNMLITDSVPPERIALDLKFIKPFPSSCLTEFTFSPADRGTTVTWTMTGKHTTMSKAMALVGSMDKFVGPMFEEGLANLERAATVGTTARPNPVA